MEKIQKTLSTKKFKRILYTAIVLLLVGWVVFRFAAIGSENARYVFNASRIAADVGAPIEYVEMKRTDGVLYEPVAVNNNRAYVTENLARKLRVGQKIGDGVITYVSSDLDLDSGMFVVRTRGVADGLQYAEYNANGFFVPLYAIENGTVFVAENGVATARTVKIGRQDSENAYIVSGLKNGDIVILSQVESGDKVQIKK